MNKLFNQTVAMGLGVSVLFCAPQTSSASTTKVSHHGTYRHNAVHRVHHVSQATPVYTVKPSDTLWAIATSHRLSVSKLKEMNFLHSDIIHPGQRLKFSGVATNGTSGRHPARITNTVTRHSTMRGVPAALVPVYVAAGKRYGIPWTVLAAIHEQETSFATIHCPVSSEGAKGPMQFLPSTFRAYGVPAPGHHGAPNINNVSDAIYTAAHYLSSNGYAHSPYSAIYHYNHSAQYVRRVLAIANV